MIKKTFIILGVIFFIGIFVVPVVSIPSQLFAGDSIFFSDTNSLSDTINANITNISQNLVMIYGTMWLMSEPGITTVISSTRVFANITGINESKTFGMTFTPNNSLRVDDGGTYKIDYSVSFGDGGNQEFGSAVGVGGVEIHECHTHRKVGSGGDTGNMGGTCIVDLSTGDIISLMMENEENPTNNADVKDASLTMIKIG